MMTPEERIAVLEDSAERGEQFHKAVVEAIQGVKAEIANLQTYLSANGGLTITFKERRVKFAGSLSIAWLLGLGSGGGGVGWFLGRVFGAW